MTDVTQQAPAEPTTTAGASDSVFSAQLAWQVQQGRMSQTDADAMLAPGATAPAPEPTATVGAGAAAQPNVAIGGDVSLFASRVAWEVQQGRLSQSEADAMLGHSAAAPADQAPDPVSTYLSEQGFPPVTPQELRLRSHLAGPDDVMTPELRNAESAITQMLVDSKLPAPIANHVIGEIAKGEQAWQAMNDGERELHSQRTRVALANLWGSNYDENLKTVRAYVLELDKKHGGKVTEVLVETGGGSNLAVISNLFLHAQRLKGYVPRK